MNADTDRALLLIAEERRRQRARWGTNDWPDGTGSEEWKRRAGELRVQCDAAFDQRVGTWRHILLEEVAEAMAEVDPDRLKAELVQVAAVACQWVESLERRSVK